MEVMNMYGLTEVIQDLEAKNDRLLEILAKEAPEAYVNQVLAKWFAEYALEAKIAGKERKSLKGDYLAWAEAYRVPEKLIEKGWKAYIDD